MTPSIATVLGFTDFAIIAWVVVVFAGAVLATRPTPDLRRVERKLDALLKYHNISVPLQTAISEEVRSLARSGQKIEAITLHRQQTGLGLAEAKADIEEFISSTQ